MAGGGSLRYSSKTDNKYNLTFQLLYPLRLSEEVYSRLDHHYKWKCCLVSLSLPAQYIVISLQAYTQPTFSPEARSLFGCWSYRKYQPASLFMNVTWRFLLIYSYTTTWIADAISMQREFVCCHEIVTKQLGLKMLVSLMPVTVVPFQLMSILHAGRGNSCKVASKLYPLTACKTTASSNTVSWHGSNLVV